MGAWNLHIFTLHGIFGRISLIFSWHFFWDCFHPLMSSCIIIKTEDNLFFVKQTRSLGALYTKETKNIQELSNPIGWELKIGLHGFILGVGVKLCQNYLGPMWHHFGAYFGFSPTKYSLWYPETKLASWNQAVPY